MDRDMRRLKRQLLGWWHKSCECKIRGEICGFLVFKGKISKKSGLAEGKNTGARPFSCGVLFYGIEYDYKLNTRYQ